MQSNTRLDNLAYDLIRLLPSDQAYEQLVCFANYISHVEAGIEPGDNKSYYEYQSNAMEQAATALMAAKDRVLAEYNQRIQEDQASSDSLFPWAGLKGTQA